MDSISVLNGQILIGHQAAKATFGVQPESTTNFIQHKCILTIYNGTKPYVWQHYVNSSYPIFEKGVLIKNDAILGGLSIRGFMEGRVASTSFFRPIVPFRA
ncbi:hypothetical protein MKX07_007805 [Trichoderma sp. CBMAI-0711]|nr:hypothetical protein MKX07_007805 [Trichoderma sp. CBMAI-0711]